MTQLRNRSLLAAAVAAAVVVLPSSRVIAQTFSTWGMAGNQGILDDSSIGLVSFSDTGSVFIRSGISSATAQLRYPILPVGAVGEDQTGHGSWCLGVQFRDTGAGARVIATLKSVNHFGGIVTSYGSFDSDLGIATGDAYETSVNCRIADPANGAGITFFNTLGRAWFVDVRLIKTSSTANPGLKSLFLTTTEHNN
jgi:hypothetical protein